MSEQPGVEPGPIVCRDGATPEPMTVGELAGVAAAMRYHDSDGLIPRLLATALAAAPGTSPSDSGASRSESGRSHGDVDLDDVIDELVETHEETQAPAVAASGPPRPGVRASVAPIGDVG